MDITTHLTQALTTLLSAGVAGMVAVIGAWVNAYVTRKKREAKDHGAAEEKIRQLQRRLGLPATGNLKTINDIHAAIREIEKALPNG